MILSDSRDNAILYIYLTTPLSLLVIGIEEAKRTHITPSLGQRLENQSIGEEKYEGKMAKKWRRYFSRLPQLESDKSKSFDKK